MSDGISIEELDAKIKELEENLQKLEENRDKLVAILNQNTEQVVLTRGALIQVADLKNSLQNRDKQPTPEKITPHMTQSQARRARRAAKTPSQ